MCDPFILQDERSLRAWAGIRLSEVALYDGEGPAVRREWPTGICCGALNSVVIGRLTSTIHFPFLATLVNRERVVSG